MSTPACSERQCSDRDRLRDRFSRDGAGRDWVVLPDSVPDFLVAKPLGGSDSEITGSSPPSKTSPPRASRLRPTDRGDDRSGRMLREALRIGFRSSGGPFRSLASLNVDPRPYQLVPLLLGCVRRPCAC